MMAFHQTWIQFIAGVEVTDDMGELPELPTESHICFRKRNGGPNGGQFVDILFPDEDEVTLAKVQEANKMFEKWYQQRLFERIPGQTKPMRAVNEFDRYDNILPYIVDINDLNDINDNIGVTNASKITDACYAGHAPIPHGFQNFWEFLWRNNLTLIVMLTDLNPNKANKYWPGEKEEMQVGNYVLRLINDINDINDINETHVCVRTIEMKDTITEEVKHFTHLHFLEWPDFGVPNMNTFRQVLHKFQELKTTHPLSYIHCSAGVGRTGTFIGADLIHTFPNMDLLELVRKMRDKRIGMVQTTKQFEMLQQIQEDLKKMSF